MAAAAGEVLKLTCLTDPEMLDSGEEGGAGADLETTVRLRPLVIDKECKAEAREAGAGGVRGARGTGRAGVDHKKTINKIDVVTNHSLHLAVLLNNLDLLLKCEEKAILSILEEIRVCMSAYLYHSVFSTLTNEMLKCKSANYRWQEYVWDLRVSKEDLPEHITAINYEITSIRKHCKDINNYCSSDSVIPKEIRSVCLEWGYSLSKCYIPRYKPLTEMGTKMREIKSA